MSAFLCDARHIGALASMLANNHENASYAREILRRGGRWRSDMELSTNVAVVLARANLVSLEAKYGDAEEWTDSGETDFLASCSAAARKRIPLDASDMVQVLSAVDCFEYQSCESPDYEGSVAAELAQFLRKWAIRKLPGYSSAEWGWPAPKGPQPISLMDVIEGKV